MTDIMPQKKRHGEEFDTIAPPRAVPQLCSSELYIPKQLLILEVNTPTLPAPH